MFIKQGSWIRILFSSWIYSISEKLKKKKQKKCTEIRNNPICIKIFKINLDPLPMVFYYWEIFFVFLNSRKLFFRYFFTSLVKLDPDQQKMSADLPPFLLKSFKQKRWA